MIPARRWQMSFADGFIAEQVDDLWEPWMRHADQALNDDQLLEIMQAAWSKLCKRARRAAVPAPRLRSSCACCCSSTFATGAMKSLRERCAPIWCIASSRRSAVARSPMTNPSLGLDVKVGPEVIEQLHQRIVAMHVRTTWFRGGNSA
jgi:hypothetical protein